MAQEPKVRIKIPEGETMPRWLSVKHLRQFYEVLDVTDGIATLSNDEIEICVPSDWIEKKL